MRSSFLFRFRSVILILGYCCFFIIPLFTCVDLKNNPVSPDYKGDYRITVDFERLPDTLSVFRDYKLSWETSGIDTFYRVAVQTEPPGNIVPFAELKPSPLPLFFVRPFSGSLIVNAYRPNGEQNTYSDSVVVVNPFRIMPDSASLLTEDQIIFQIQNIRTGETAPRYLKCRWRHGETVVNAPADSIFAYTAGRPDTITLTAVLLDSLEHAIALPSLSITIPEKLIPVATLAEKNIFVPIDYPFTLIAGEKNSDTLFWTVAGKDTTISTIVPEFTNTWTDTTTDTVIVTPKNRFGAFGTSDTVFITPKPSTLDLALLSFPSSAAAHKVTEWKVGARRNGTFLPDSEVIYTWEVLPATEIDSINRASGTLSLVPSESAKEFTIRVGAIAGTDTLWPRTISITVVADRPIFKMTSSGEAASIDEPIDFRFKAFDSNSDGIIVASYYKLRSDSTATPLSTDSLALTFYNPGKRYVSFWCVDDDGFTSDTVSIELTITSDHPWFLHASLDTVMYIDDSVTIAAPAKPGTTGGTITTWLWDFDNDGIVDRRTDSDRFDTLFMTSEKRRFIINCIDNRSDSTTTPMILSIDVANGEPVIKSITRGNLPRFRGDTLALVVTASDTNGTIDSLLLLDSKNNILQRKVYSPGSSVIFDTLNHAVNEVGVYRFAVQAFDNLGYHSAIIPWSDSLRIASGNPVVTGCTPAECWIYDTTAFTIHATDPDNGIKQFRIQWEADAPWEEFTDSLVQHRYTSTGTGKLRIVAIDSRSNMSDTLNDSVAVKTGAPSVSAASIPSTVYLLDTTAIQLTGTDPNGSVIQWGIQWAANEPFEVVTSAGAFSHIFTSAGTAALRCFVVDNDGIASDTVAKEITVKRGEPGFTSIGTISSQSIFINDSILFRIKGTDPNGTVDSLLLWVNNDTAKPPLRSPIISDSTSVKLSFTIDDVGNHDLRFRIIDNSGISTDSIITISVRKGTPVITLVKCDSTKLWVNDMYRYHVSAHDTNGTIRKFYADWSGGNVVNDSIVVPAGRQSVDTFFTHVYDTASSGSRTPIFRTIDEDGIVSGGRETTVAVYKGAPVLWAGNNANGDTIWMVVDKGYGDYYYKPYYSDSNGVIDTFYFGSDVENISIAKKTYRVDSTLLQVDDIVVNHGTNKWLWVKDDDGLITGKKFVVYADSAPPKPKIVGAGGSGSPINIAWSGKDLKDGNSTLYTILLKKNSAPSISDSLISFKPGTNHASGEDYSSDFKYTFTPNAGSGIYYYRVVAKDARGTKTESDNGTFFY